MTQYNEYIGKIQLFAIIDPQGMVNIQLLKGWRPGFPMPMMTHEFYEGSEWRWV